MRRSGARSSRSTATGPSRPTSNGPRRGSVRASSIPRERHGDVIVDCGLSIADLPCEFVRHDAAADNPQSAIRNPQSDRRSHAVTGPRTVRAPRGPQRSCKGWVQEAALRLIMYGQMTAGSWIYIGTQGILQGTYETFGAVAQRHFGGSLKGRIVLSGGLGGMGGAQPLAATMHDAVCLVVEVDAARVQRRRDTRYLDRSTASLEEALGWCDEAKRAGRALSIGLVGNCADVLPLLVRRGFVPDGLTDQTSAHDALNGYIPPGLSVGQAA